MSSGTFIYTVRHGDTLWLLADRYNTTVEDIINLNPGIDPDRLAVGQQLCLPLIESDIDDFDPVLAMNNLARAWSEAPFLDQQRLPGRDFDLPIAEAAKGLRECRGFCGMFLDYYGKDFRKRSKAFN